MALKTMSASSNVLSWFGVRGCFSFWANNLADLPFKTGAFSGLIYSTSFSDANTRLYTGYT